MKKIRHLIIFMTILLFSSCDFALFDKVLNLNENPFIRPEEISANDGDDKINLLIVSDAHFNREYRDSGVEREDGNFFYFIGQNESNIDAILFLGDMLDDAVKMDIETLNIFIDEIEEALSGKEIIYAIGNHDINKGMSVKQWEKEFGQSQMDSYRIEDTVIYKLNSAYRLFGHDQLKALADAVKINNAKYNLFISHIPLGSKGADQSVFEFTIGNINERNAMLKIAAESNGAFTLSAHHHKGNVLNEWAENHKEYIFPAFHKRDLMNLESEGMYHLLTLDQRTGEITIRSYLIHNTSHDLNSPDEIIKFTI